MAPGAKDGNGSSNDMLSPYSTLGQFSYAPATQTTVVTTTTTTTTSFPPFVMKAPKNLCDRDPETYPLAATLTPGALKKLKLDIGGASVLFEEADSINEAWNEHKTKSAALAASQGTIQSVTTTTADGDITKATNPRKRSTVDGDALLERIIQLNEARTQSATPMSMSETTELESFRRRNRSGQSTPANHARTFTSSGQLQDAQSDSETCDGSSQTEDVLAQNHQAPSPLERTMAPPFGGSAFVDPPVVDSHQPSNDETMGEGVDGRRSSTIGPRRSAVPPRLSTSPLQDASLPSPSLSPIRAAAALNLSNAPSRFFPDESSESALQRATSIARTAEQENTDGPARPQAQLGSTRAVSRTEDSSPPTFDEIPRMLDSFDAMPDALKTYVMHQFLRRCPKTTLHFVADTVNPALKCDFFRRLPLELSLHITKYLDAQTMCRAAQVSKKWRHIVNSDETAWKNLIEADGLQIPHGEVERAIREGWGWQCPNGEQDYEMNLAPKETQDIANTRSADTARMAGGDSTVDGPSTRQSPKRKRKGSSKQSSSKKQKRKASSTKLAPSPAWMDSLEIAQGPNAYANAAALAVPNPEVGLEGLRSLHLFKSIYQRNYLIRESWMRPETQPHHLAFRAHQRHVVTCLQFDENKILTGSDDANIDIYNTKTGASIKRLEGHEGGVWALEYHGNILVSGSTDRSVRVWNMETGKCLQVFQGHTSTVRCLQILQPVKVGETSEGKPIYMPKQPLIITGSRDSTCRVWKLPKLEDRSFHLASPGANDLDNPYYLRTLAGHHHSVRAIAAHADTLVSGSYDATVRVWKISTGELVHRLSGHTTKVYSVVLDYERGRCISGSMDNLVKVWSLETGSCLFNLEGHTSLVGLLDLRDDCLVSAAADSTLRIWDPENGRCQHVLSAHTGAITCFAHDGQKVISGSDGTLKMWNTKTGDCVRDLLSDLSGVWQIKFDTRRCIAAVQRNSWTYIEVLDFGASRDGKLEADRGRRIVVNALGDEIEDRDVDSESDGAEVADATADADADADAVDVNS